MYAKQDREILTQLGDSCYTVVRHQVSWTHAEYICNQRGGHLFDVTSQTQNMFIYILLNTHFNHSVWMGLHDMNREEHFEWTSGMIPDKNGSNAKTELFINARTSVFLSFCLISFFLEKISNLPIVTGNNWSNKVAGRIHRFI